MIRGNPARRYDDLPPVRLHRVNLLLTRLLIRDDDVRKPTNRARHRDRRARVPTRRRHHRHTLLELARLQRSVQNLLSDSILDASRRIQILTLAINPNLWVRTERAQIDHRRASDQLLRNDRSVGDPRVRRSPVLRLLRRHIGE